MNIIYVKNSGAKICLPIEFNIKLIFVLTISPIVKIVSYYVFLITSKLMIHALHAHPVWQESS